MSESLEDTLRGIIREELAPVETRLTERIVGVERGLEDVRQDLAALRRELVGVIDERFPPVGDESWKKS